MLLTSIKLSGFKSFVDPTNFQVHGQLVGVVGPNGCGKSNIIDAVRWVLGESRAAELRGESMQDVIFNGSTNRKPAGRASVELVFDNSHGKVSGQWGQYAEISVRRVLARDGSSTYYINNQVVRRRDIQDIFMGTGLGPRAYAIIGQGMISRIIEARPDELRVFLEEAAGVSRYKERRRETENRLHDTRENLHRVEDILRELETNLGKLESQAEVARKYHELQSEQDEKQKLLWLMRRNDADAERVRISREIEKAQSGLEAQTADLRRMEAALEHLRQAHFSAGDRMHQAQGYLYQTNSEIGSLEAQIRFVFESRSRMQAQINALEQQRTQWQQQGKQQQQELTEAGTKLEELDELARQSQEQVRQQSEILPTHELAWREAQEKASGLRAATMQVQQQIQLASAQHRNASGMLASLTTRSERLARESAELQVPDAAQLTQLTDRLDETQRALAEEQNQIEVVRQQRVSLEESRRSAQEQLNRENTSLTTIEARLTALKQLQQNVQSQGKVQPWLTKHELGGLPRLWQKLQIEPGWETALEAVLRERMSALEISHIEWANAFMTDAPPAKLAFFSKTNASLATGNNHIPSGMTPLFNLLKLNDADLDAMMREWLLDVFVAPEATDVFPLREALPSGGCLVTRDGHLIGRSSVRFYAPDSEQDGMMARKQEIDRLDLQQREQKAQADEARAGLAREDAALTQCGRQLQECRQRADMLTKTAHELQLTVLKLSEMQQRYEQRSTQIETDLAEIREQEAVQRQGIADAEQRLEQLDVALASAQNEYENCQTDYLTKEHLLNEARQRLRDCERTAQEA
ncbi:MAG: chromosome segregation protein SMC, partial [Burkholderiaceae bacterium]|nr:chromosome segregation protein SMC [Burkholderiaceae bacterium]